MTSGFSPRSPVPPSSCSTRHAWRTLGAHASALPPSGDASCSGGGELGVRLRCKTERRTLCSRALAGDCPAPPCARLCLCCVCGTRLAGRAWVTMRANAPASMGGSSPGYVQMGAAWRAGGRVGDGWTSGLGRRAVASQHGHCRRAALFSPYPPALHARHPAPPKRGSKTARHGCTACTHPRRRWRRPAGGGTSAGTRQPACRRSFCGSRKGGREGEGGWVHCGRSQGGTAMCASGSRDGRPAARLLFKGRNVLGNLRPGAVAPATGSACRR